ncbi:OprO/OprP family phosphate-selective porin [Pseudomonas sp. NPDC087612]|uniref:OprO/OprP family phosphate-selective porin n=1 Tax=unclassified Pseudomonas TaxID=196821 RepID=UPI0005EB82DE|nr:MULTISPECIES: OprO/OprP family phosphate-selective porin [unclassified Pseudomonas]KJK20184.1 porin [Pseudomonas sp. 2(2015)]QPG60662.1 OprO/OprP family phosphate-selective porin [Pseudomonas sp. BIGb0427]QVM95420.1 OprO/OprP family phosphate-selective porin [Pseudomonas sp. SORT22]UVL57720.1 OprO/OprP family phosphate-selective porin [Pseudomonas sp. B21-035]UVL63028.1 OprO/OprP family phosphate-selective porin [Pseudomonas sp. B21-032]
MIRKHFAGFVASALAMAVTAQAFAGTVTTDGADIVVKTKGGLEVATTDKEFSFKLGGRIQADYSRFDGFYTNNGNTADAGYFRRAYLELGGVMYKDWAYQIAYDFSHNSGGDNRSEDGYFDEASLAYNGFSPVSIKVGRFDPEFGLEKATSSKWVTAQERTAAYDLVDWTNAHNGGLGIQASGTVGDSLYGSVGAFAKDATNQDKDGDSTKQFNLRGVFAPMHEAGNVLHFGINYAQRDLSDTAFDGRIRSRLGMRGVSTDGGQDAGSNGNRLTLGGANNTPAGAYDTDKAWGLEAAWAMGPFSVQGEYVKRDVQADSASFSDIKADGYYGQLAYTITGEARGYKLGKFDSIKPSNKQIGAWEVFYRYDHLSVDDDNGAFANIDDVEGKVHNVGLNWYANESIKLSGVYVKAKVDNAQNAAGDDSGDGFVMRAQYVF